MIKENNGETEAREAKHGEKMISLNVRFWTDDIAEEPEKIVPKHAWTSGTIRLERNHAHGVESGSSIPFNSLMELPAVIEELLTREGIILHPNQKMGKYIQTLCRS